MATTDVDAAFEHAIMERGKKRRLVFSGDALSGLNAQFAREDLDAHLATAVARAKEMGLPLDQVKQEMTERLLNLD